MKGSRRGGKGRRESPPILGFLLINLLRVFTLDSVTPLELLAHISRDALEAEAFGGCVRLFTGRLVHSSRKINCHSGGLMMIRKLLQLVSFPFFHSAASERRRGYFVCGGEAQLQAPPSSPLSGQYRIYRTPCPFLFRIRPLNHFGPKYQVPSSFLLDPP